MQKVVSKINRVIEKLGTLQKDGNNAFQNFQFISYEQLNAKLRILLPQIGLGIVPEIESIERNFSTNGNKTVCNSLVKMSFDLIDEETGEKITKVFYGEANDTADKATAKAITECQKRFEFKLFHVSSFEDKDNDANHIETPSTIAKKAMIMGDTAYSKLMERIRKGDNIAIETVEEHYTLTKIVKEVLQKAIDEASEATQA